MGTLPVPTKLGASPPRKDNLEPISSVPATVQLGGRTRRVQTPMWQLPPRLDDFGQVTVPSCAQFPRV